MTVPRPTFAITTPGFAAASTSALTRCRVSSVPGSVTTTPSKSPTRAARSLGWMTSSTPSTSHVAAAGAGDVHALAREPLGDEPADRPEADDQHPAALEAPHHPAGLRPLVRALRLLQPRQRLEAGEQPEHAPLGERHRVHAGGRREADPLELLLRQVRALHLAAAACGHQLDPLQRRVRAQRPRELGRPLPRDPVQHLRGVDELLEPSLVRLRPPERGITGVVARVQLRREEVLRHDQVEPGLGGADAVGEVLGQRGRGHRAEASFSHPPSLGGTSRPRLTPMLQRYAPGGLLRRRST